MVKIISSKVSLVTNVDIFAVLLFLIPPMILYVNYLVRGVVFTWPIFILWLTIILIKNKDLGKFVFVLKNRLIYFVLLSIFLFIVLFNYSFVETSSRGFQYIVVFINFSILLIIDSYYSVKPIRYKLSILFYIILALGIQALISIPYLLSSDYYLIRLFSSGQLDSYRYLEAIKNGVGNNGLYSSIGAISLLGISVSNKFRVLPRIVLYLCISSLIITILISTFFASIFLLSIGVLILLIRYYKFLFNLNVIIYFIVVSLFSYYFYLSFLQDTNFFIPIEKKVNSFLVEYGDSTGRTDLAYVSINTFFDNPFFGVGVPELGSYNIVGEHMPWVDYFAHFGFFGFLPFLIFIYILIRSNFKYFFIKDAFSFYRITCFIGVNIFLLSNLISPMLTVPSMYFMFILFYTSIGKDSCLQF